MIMLAIRTKVRALPFHRQRDLFLTWNILSEALQRCRLNGDEETEPKIKGDYSLLPEAITYFDMTWRILSAEGSLN